MAPNILKDAGMKDYFLFADFCRIYNAEMTVNPLHDMPVGTPCIFRYTTGLTKSDASTL